MSTQLYSLTASALADLLEKGETTSEEITRSFITRTKEVDSTVKAFLHFDEEDALVQAKASDERRQQGQSKGPLDGIPVALKDNLAVKGQPLTCASKMLGNFTSPYDGTVVGKLKEAGAVLWGRLNMDEFAMGSSTENSSRQTTANPWNFECIPGGSSGGSAASVSALETPLSLGSDTGGSIRQPAALCGVIGMKPTYGLVSRYGLVAFASSLDQIGPFARSVDDTATLLQAIVGHDPLDSTSYKTEIPDYRAEVQKPLEKSVVGLPKEYLSEGIDPEVEQAVKAAVKWYEDQGSEVVEVSLPHTEYAVGVYYIIATAEASSNLARYDGVRYGHRSEKPSNAIDLYFHSRAEGFGEEVKRRIILGTYVLSSGYYDAYYLKAQKVRTLIRQDFLKAFEKVDFLLTPTSPVPAFGKGERTANPLAMYLSDIYTISANLAGIPGVSIPGGFTQSGLPIGLQLLGKPFDEAGLLRAAKAFESGHDYHLKTPPLG
ncbi:MAG: Asp-tRNA(Asn)/Glu-tRNA(Gln) amidotransferase subunit GatA [Opitutales bacterium]|nr:Asp-tRNA(Asn)/Glu-tRNA(Gln) amidotransferase subunit GatA [Opitutales bacterium]